MSPAIDLPKLREIRKKLKGLPKLDRAKTFTAPEALEALKKDILALSRKGYDSKEIANILKREGLAASAAKVKKLLADGQPQNGDSAADQSGNGKDAKPDPLAAPGIAESGNVQPSDNPGQARQPENMTSPAEKTAIRRPANSKPKSNIQEAH